MRHALIVIPCYNEQARLPTCEFERFVQEHPEIGFHFVNDGSTDGTDQLLRALCRRAPLSLRCTTINENVGKAEAVRRGMLEALSVPGVRYVGFWDADLATPLEAISSFLQVHEQRPQLILVMGARVRLLGRRVVREAGRHFMGRVFAMAASGILSLPVYDTQCGAKLFRVDALTRRLFQEPFSTRWVFDVEILARMLSLHALAMTVDMDQLVYEFPLLQWHEVKGSKRKPHDYLLALRDLYLIRERYLRKLPVRIVRRMPSLTDPAASDAGRGAQETSGLDTVPPRR